MRLPRRRFLFIACSSVLYAGVSRTFGAMIGGRSDGFSKGLLAWVDTLLPRDGESPAASELGVHEELIEKAIGIPHYTRLLKAGISWADAQAKDRGALSFWTLDELAREAVVAKAEGMDLKSVPGYFFNQTLRDVRQLYYAHASSWAGVSFPNRPQPIGYADYQEEPRGE